MTEFNGDESLNNHTEQHYGQLFPNNPMPENDTSDSTLMNKKPLQKIINQRDALISQLSNFQYECTICYVKLKPDNPIWSCENCYHMFHIDCIKKWYKTCVDDVDDIKWRCPTCQKEYVTHESAIVYHCFCGKLKNPEYKRGTLIHSCGDVCGKTSRTNDRCPHLCSAQCHPGPCPACDASITGECHCSKATLTVKCSTSEKHLICGNPCERLLNCFVHSCEALCHSGDCDPCQQSLIQSCYCQTETRTVLCGSVPISGDYSFSCGRICDKLKDCNNHRCSSECHSGPCQSCVLLPENVSFCMCGKTALGELVASRSTIGDRRSCLDEIPTCEKVCDKRYSVCSHRCPSRCHQGECAPCTMSSSVRCRCGKTSQQMKCTTIALMAAAGTPVLCSVRCKSKKACGNHRCGEICCGLADVHSECQQPCRKQLSCGRHSCDRLCHRGGCGACPNVSFEELYCDCGEYVALPPIACGQSPPTCERACGREHVCEHPVLHQCHSEPECPPCTVLTAKMCPGEHTVLHNVPCFRPVVTCGLPCRRPLIQCSHHCARQCHAGPCTDELFRCAQLCRNVRPNCRHPCNALCHEGNNCDGVMGPCQVTIELRCGCNHKSMNIVCHKLQHAIKAQAKSGSDPFANRKEAGLDLLVSANNGEDQSVLLRCDSDCRRAARQRQIAEAFETEIGMSSDSGSYTGFLRDYSTKNPSFLVKIDGEFVKLIRKLEAEKLGKLIHRFELMNRDQRRFIHELSKYFGLHITSVESESKGSVTIEAVKGVCKIPNTRLLQFMQKNYPQLFKSPQQFSIKHVSTPNSANRLLYTSRMNSLGFSKQS